MTYKSIFTALMSLVVLAVFSGTSPAQAEEEKKEPAKKVKVKKTKKEKTTTEEKKTEGAAEENKEAAPE